MSPTRSRYKELGLEVVDPLKDCPCRPWNSFMGEENRDEGEKYPFKLFLEESLTRERNKMMDNFSQIIQ
jgi:hypothetical protein